VLDVPAASARRLPADAPAAAVTARVRVKVLARLAHRVARAQIAE
jgi:hypothetical protein